MFAFKQIEKIMTLIGAGIESTKTTQDASSSGNTPNGVFVNIVMSLSEIDLPCSKSFLRIKSKYHCDCCRCLPKNVMNQSCQFLYYCKNNLNKDNENQLFPNSLLSVLLLQSYVCLVPPWMVSFI